MLLFGLCDGTWQIPVADFPSLTTEKVIEVTIYAGRDTPPNQWLSITEVSSDQSQQRMPHTPF